MKFLTISFGFLMLAFSTNGEEIQSGLEASLAKKIDPLLKLKDINRNFDGTGNNLKNPQWGAVNADLQRLCDPNYSDGISKMWEQKPNVRLVNTIIGEVDDNKISKDKNGINALFPIFGQFLDHDITMTPPGNDEYAPIKVPQCDLHFDPECKGNVQIPFSRSIYNPKKKVRTNINVITAWIDGSQIYGCTKEKSDSLRSFKSGKLKCSDGGMLIKDSNGFYISGDPRINENIGLSSIHTAFLREHNRLCDTIAKKYPSLCDDQIYTMARNYVIGLIQHITFDQYLPLLLGQQHFKKYIGDYKGYDEKTSPNIITEFSTAGYRLHSLVYYPFVMVDDQGKTVCILKESQMLSNPNLVKPDSLKQIFNGLMSNPMKQRGIELTNELRNGLILTPNRSQKFDLYSANLQRGRDHGICSIPNIRKVLGLNAKKTFCEIFENHRKAHQLQKLYQQLENVDLYFAILGQKLIKGAVLGQIGTKLDGLQFNKIRNGDRFWYENAFPEAIVKEIKQTSFADVLRRNACIKNLWTSAFKKV